ncbi:outer membrane lipoprotein chaperone LolA [Shewanella sp. D64]|uniref:outer membrane lipoprotein chaperone LolA n=1 Tax=unclassified Shewanella TaxID=196818 RepID=UPI0022BA201C|nr:MULTISPECIES: outer membrane lipoprotein chaperone LolA [unclassified Shewanella]MEC4723950.1 outer membrane lipoprotein chaperone LolA [Shewanella sp. D64]MEC4735970.1 outer membrane lipoprotein chaperone LolA [Shewanella sp. E94]WBJ93065.1 outer membrane lipoprotein chaperone LolA [Shewanella sp. MTB7]
MRKTLSALVLTLPLLTSHYALADESSALKTKLAEVATLKAKFEQTVTDINNKLIQKGSGIFALAYPNQFYWHLTAPDESLIVADGKDVWIYNPFAEEVSVMDLNQAINASPIALLVHRDEKTWSQYSVTRNNDCFSIKPKSIDAGVESVKVCFDDKTLTEMVLQDQQGNISQFMLSEQTAIADAELSMFKFTVPEDVDIDDQRLKLIN